MKNNNFLPRLFFSLFISSTAFFFSACDPDSAPATPKGAYEKGVFILNEGSFRAGNSAVSFYNRDSKTVEADIFAGVNNRPLGDVAQSITQHNDQIYLVINNSNKIEIVEANTFAELHTINNLALPRFLAVANNKAYVTEYVNFSGNGQVSVIDLNTHTVVKTIAVGKLPENLLAVNNKLYVVNSGENFVSVINTNTDVVEKTLTLADSPNSLVLDANNKIWILAGGKKVYKPDFSVDATNSTPGTLIRLNPTTQAVELSLPFASRTSSPTRLITNGARNKLHYQYGGKIYQFDITAAALPTNTLINRSFYGLGIDPSTDILYGGDAGFFTSAGKVVRFNPNGSALDSFPVGIAPNGFLFR
jgi:YVTN family beta-propeller protein